MTHDLVYPRFFGGFFFFFFLFSLPRHAANALGSTDLSLQSPSSAGNVKVQGQLKTGTRALAQLLKDTSAEQMLAVMALRS